MFRECVHQMQRLASRKKAPAYASNCIEHAYFSPNMPTAAASATRSATSTALKSTKPTTADASIEYGRAHLHQNYQNCTKYARMRNSFYSLNRNPATEEELRYYNSMYRNNYGNNYGNNHSYSSHTNKLFSSALLVGSTLAVPMSLLGNTQSDDQGSRRKKNIARRKLVLNEEPSITPQSYNRTHGDKAIKFIDANEIEFAINDDVDEKSSVINTLNAASPDEYGYYVAEPQLEDLKMLVELHDQNVKVFPRVYETEQINTKVEKNTHVICVDADSLFFPFEENDPRFSKVSPGKKFVTRKLGLDINVATINEDLSVDGAEKRDKIVTRFVERREQQQHTLKQLFDTYTVGESSTQFLVIFTGNCHYRRSAAKENVDVAKENKESEKFSLPTEWELFFKQNNADLLCADVKLLDQKHKIMLLEDQQIVCYDSLHLID